METGESIVKTFLETKNVSGPGVEVGVYTAKGVVVGVSVAVEVAVFVAVFTPVSVGVDVTV
jgi:hypothetical protein